MTTLVTGGLGWVPSHIVKAIAETGEPVVVVDLMDPDGVFANLMGDLGTQVTVISGDTSAEGVIADVVREHSVTAIIHAAAITPRRERELAEPERIIAVNLGALVHVLQVARTTPAIRRTVFISSGSALGTVTDGDHVDEATPSAAGGLYDVLKHTGERLVHRYRNLFGIDAVSVRLANVYGPMERFTPGYSGATELREILRIYAAGETVRINSLAGPWLDWTYVSDIADGVRTIWQAPHLAHDLYTLTCGELFSMGDVLAAFARNLPGFRYEVVPASEANYIVSGDPPGPVTSPGRIREELGWTTTTSFADGMATYLQWIQTYGTY